MEGIRILKGDFIYSKSQTELEMIKDGFLLANEKEIIGLYTELPKEYKEERIEDYTGKLIIPGFTDLHVHAPQYTFRGLGMNMELIPWLNTYTFPAEAKYADVNYAKKTYPRFVEDLKNSTTTRAGIFGTIHVESTKYLMDLIEESGVVAGVGKVNMDRNSPENLCEGTTRAGIFGTIHVESTKYLMDLIEESGVVAGVGKVNMDRNSPENLCEGTEESLENTRRWLSEIEGRYDRVFPILTPRFIPSCSDRAMEGLEICEGTEESLENTRRWLSEIEGRYDRVFPILTPRFIPSCSDRAMEGLEIICRETGLPVQSHLSENISEIDWVQELHPDTSCYAEAYDKYGLCGSMSKTIMAHCVHSDRSEKEMELLDWVQELHPDTSCYAEAYDKYGLCGSMSKTIMAHCVHSDRSEKEMELLRFYVQDNYGALRTFGS